MHTLLDSHYATVKELIRWLLTEFFGQRRREMIPGPHTNVKGLRRNFWKSTRQTGIPARLYKFGGKRYRRLLQVGT